MLRNLKFFNPSEIEEKVLSLWKEKDVFRKTLTPKKGKKAKIFKFWEGPPYANGRPGIHHVLSRVMKDVFLRHRTMKDFVVPRIAGWDTHGLPVEIEAEKQLGIKSKKEIEDLGIENFNNKAKEAVWKYRDEWEKLTERIGFWLDLKRAYITYYPKFIESLWWVFKKVFERGFLKEFYKVVPYCPRCQTPLSNHELGQPGVYKQVPDPSVYIKLKIKGKKDEYLLVWTTTPWTLPANVAVAVLPNAIYKKYKNQKEYIWALRIPEVISKQFNLEEVESISGEKMIGWEYEPLYKYSKPMNLPTKLYSVLGADFVSVEDGTGIVHIAPTFGEDDFNLIFKDGIKDIYHLPETVEDNGVMSKGIIGEGLFVKEADKVVLEDLEKRNILLFKETIEHEYPFCWRCSSPLIYFAKKSWFFEVSRLRKEMVAANKKVNWYPDYIKEGRFGEWIAQAKDWSISRDRYWGTPLPIWKCGDCKKITVAGSLEELNKKSFERNKFLLLRHGESTSNLGEKWIASGSETGKFISKLTEKGKNDIKKTAKLLAKEKIDLIFSSPYKRTKDTAEIVAKELGLKVAFDKRLAEINCGVLNHKKVMDLEKFCPVNERFRKAPEGGETLNQVRERVLNFVGDLNKKYQGKNILIVSHGDPLWMIGAGLGHLSEEETLQMDYPKKSEFRKMISDNWPQDKLGMVDMHRPYIDDIILKCDHCGKKASRITDVADVWFDSGCMPYGSTHFPFEGDKGQKVPVGFPADFICEGIDQTRGWFYTLLASSVLLGHGPAYLNVVSLGLVLDKYGQKMSKSKGNIVDPWSVIQKYGVDSIRWYFYTVNSPAEPKSFDEEEINKAMRRYVSVIYNSFVFLNLYGKSGLNLDKERKVQNALDNWILSRLAETAGEVDELMNNYSIYEASGKLDVFVDDLSRWYIRRSRRRLQKPQNQKELEDASWTLGYVLLCLSKISAPFTPFFAEALYQSLKKNFKFKSADSIHLESWPQFKKGVFNTELNKAMLQLRSLASQALSKRAEVQIKVRQPLSKLSIREKDFDQLSKSKLRKELFDILREEINVKEVKLEKNLAEAFVLDIQITSQLKLEGTLRELTRIIQDLRQEAGYVPKDKIIIYVKSEQPVEAIFRNNSGFFSDEVGAKKIEFGRVNKFDAELNTKIDNNPMYLAVKKIK